MNKIKRNTIKCAVSRLSITVNAETSDSSIYHAFRYTVYVCMFVCLSLRCLKGHVVFTFEICKL